FAETDVKSDFRHRQFALRQQALGAFDAPAGKISMWRHADGLLKGAGKMERAELRQLGQRGQGDVLGEVFVDVLHQLLLLPVGEPTANARYKRRDTLVHAHELVCQCDSERLDIGTLILS